MKSLSSSQRGLLIFTSTLSLLAPLAFAPAAQADDSTHIAAIIARGDTDITNRTTSLSTLITLIGAEKHLTAAQKAALTSEMQTQSAGLTTLKSILDGSTTLDAAKTNFQDIFSQFYIYAFYMPRIRRIDAASNEVDAAALLTSLLPKFQGYINQAKTAGADTTSLQATYTDLSAKAADAQTKAQSVIDSLTPLTASGYPGNKGTVQTAQATIKAARTDLETARSDARTLETDLKKVLSSVS